MAERKPTPRLYRRCPSCGVVQAASEFRRAGGSWETVRLIRCPVCGHVAQTMAFPRVDPPAGVHPARRPCRAVRKDDGSPCRIAAVLDSDFCRHHLPPARTEGAGGAVAGEAAGERG